MKRLKYAINVFVKRKLYEYEWTKTYKNLCQS